MNSRAIVKPGLRSTSGQTIIEFAISALVFLLLLFSVVDFSYFYFVKLTLQNAVRQAGRYAITGQAMGTQSRYQSILQTTYDYSLGLANSTNTTVCSLAKGCGSGGGPGDTVTITITYPYRFITPFIAHYFTGGSYTITVSTTFKNEPFPPSQT
ncbi:MAG TPA: TadE family protein [Candidatus Bathyarchaeia archaeon]|nr:TadE family protein [Candidatus Bathyarchaeia archaeon]